mmetsp:Transcript_679/g.1770  ORF Transcript_679/g.1770 Transcript_679/m.1770 type:complete len:406 (+) Transcript_679:818-2035(+)
MRHGCLVCTQDVPLVKPCGLSHRLLVEFLGVGGLVKVQVASERLVGALSGENHLHSEGLDLPREEIHRDSGSDLVPRLQVIHHLWHGIDRLLWGEVKLVVVGSQKVRHLPRVRQVWRPLDSDGESVQALGPVQGVLCLALVLGCYGRDQAGVQTSGEQDAEGHVRHQALEDGVDDRLPYLGKVHGVGWNVVLLDKPLGFVPPDEVGLLSGSPGAVVPRREVLVGLDTWGVLEALHLGSNPGRPVVPVSNVEWGDAHVVSAGHEHGLLATRVDDGEHEHAVEHIDEGGPVLLVHEPNDLTVRGRSAVEAVLLSQLLEVIYLSVDHPAYRALGVLHRLVSAFRRVHDGEPLVSQEVLLAVRPHAAPVWTSVAYPRSKLDDKPAQRRVVARTVQECKYPTHSAVTLSA